MTFRALFSRWTYQVFAPGALLRQTYDAFRDLLEHDRRALQLLSRLEEAARPLPLSGESGRPAVDWARVEWLARRLRLEVGEVVGALKRMRPARWADLGERFSKLDFYAEMAMAVEPPEIGAPWIVTLAEAAEMDRERSARLIGGKAANLARAKAAGLPVPDGFALTSNAFNYLLEDSGLSGRRARLLRSVDLDSPRSGRVLAEVSARLTAMILKGGLPGQVARDLREAARALLAGCPPGTRLAVRSSAVAEDSATSFAGLYDSILNVPPERLGEAALQVLAGKFSARALAYRIRMGLLDEETPMAALVMPMVQARAAGVAYTRDPLSGGGSGALVLHAVSGLGLSVVDGSETALEIRPDVIGDEGVRRSRGQIPAADLAELSRLCGELERLFGGPQDVEWAVGPDGPAILQSRPLRQAAAEAPKATENATEKATKAAPQAAGGSDDPARVVTEWAAKLPVGRKIPGRPASPGAALGETFLWTPPAPLEDAPRGCVLVAWTLTPELARVAERLAGVVSAYGGPAGHFASVAREFGVPVAVVGPAGFKRLREIAANGRLALFVPSTTPTRAEGAEGRSGKTQIPAVATVATIATVTPEEAECAHFRPVAEALAMLSGKNAGPRNAPDSPFDRRLKAILAAVSPLSLTDPESPDFTPERARSLHDLVRFCHEQAVAGMFQLVDRGGRGMARARKLDSPLPLQVRLLDLGQGFGPSVPPHGDVRPEHVASEPWQALWAGLTDPSAEWDPDRPHFDWAAMAEAAGGGGVIAHDSALLASYAAFSRDYLHLMARFGFHFAVVDALCGEHASGNHLSFRFKGGGGGERGRALRIGLVAETLSGAGFRVKVTGDMLDASAARLDKAACLARLRLIGLILARTRVLDMALESESGVLASGASDATDASDTTGASGASCESGAPGTRAATGDLAALTEEFSRRAGEFLTLAEAASDSKGLLRP